MSRPVDELLERLLAPDLDDSERRALLDEIEAHGAGEDLRLVEEAFAALAFSLKPEQPAREVRRRLLSGLDPSDRFQDFVGSVAALLDLTEEMARDVLRQLDDPAAWSQGPRPGILLLLPEVGPARAGWLRVAVKVDPGVEFPYHVHLGDEQFFVVQGSGVENDGNETRRGQGGSRPKGSGHSFVALPGPPLILFAVVDGRVQFE